MLRTTLVLGLMSVALGGCALRQTPPAASTTAAVSEDQVTRVRTTVGSFEIQARNADLLRRMLAGEAVDVQFYAGGADL
jgi:hypothetical protein